MKFLADMGISPKTVEFLRGVGHESVNQHLKVILDQHGGALEEGAIVSVTERHFRVRSLPV